ncbi:MAG TPA: hypothetical protein DD381_14650 [Lentisphaeria bacterium]|nr:MAG: hypothetical protein A2X47_01460 [Lentisphaerae bacterium GWF2_38_69]HBM17564.1 hypothetical protein [Lentisphaeria bacterium]
MNIYENILSLQRDNNPFVLITVVAKEGHGPQVSGAKMCVLEDGKIFGTIGGGALEFLAIKEAVSIIKNHKPSVLQKYILGEDNKVIDAVSTGMICGGSITLFFEVNGSKENIFIFGAGHIGQALAYHLNNLNFRVTVIDSRKEYENSCEKYAHKIVIEDYNTALSTSRIPSNSFFVIATHSHEMDFILLKRICSSDWNPKYIGAIASKKKSESVIKRLAAELNGKNIPWDRIYCPIGLKIGGTTPHEIAISIVSEIQSIQYAKEGNFHAKGNYKTILSI